VAFEDVMAATTRLLASSQALAGVVAHLRLEELGEEGDAAVRVQLERVLDELGLRDELDALAPEERAVVVAFNRSYLRQALDLVEEPARAGAWSHTDPTLLRAEGSASAVVARLFAAAGLGAPGARILDVGTGVAGLAIAFCTAFRGSTVVGVDPWEPSLAIARENVAEAGLGERITLLATTVQELADDDGFDLIWFPSFFIPEAVLDDALARLHGLTRPGGVLVLGVPYGIPTTRWRLRRTTSSRSAPAARSSVSRARGSGWRRLVSRTSARSSGAGRRRWASSPARAAEARRGTCRRSRQYTASSRRATPHAPRGR
jgi:SAM-dependent methyltransferase